MIHVICILEPFFMREEFLHMENKNAGYIWHPVLTHYSWIKKYKTKFKKLKTEEKKTCKIPVL